MSLREGVGTGATLRGTFMKILVTGATGAIGSALTAQLAALGHTLLISARNTVKLDALASGHANITPCAADLTDASDLARLFSIAAEAGPFDAMVNCIGSTIVRPLHLTSLADWDNQFAINATTSFNLLKWFIAQATRAGVPFFVARYKTPNRTLNGFE